MTALADKHPRPQHNHPPIQESIERLPSFFYGKSVELIDKAAMMAVYMAFSISQGMEAAFSEKFDTSATNVQLSLKNSKEFKEWHREVEDFIDDSIKQSRKLMRRFSDVVFGVTNKDKLKEYVSVVQSFDFFKDRVDLAFQTEKMSLTAWGLKELSKLLDKARGSQGPPKIYNTRGFFPKDMVNRSLSSARSRNIRSMSAFEYIDDEDKSGMLPAIRHKGWHNTRSKDKILSDRSLGHDSVLEILSTTGHKKSNLRGQMQKARRSPDDTVRGNGQDDICLVGDAGIKIIETSNWPFDDIALVGGAGFRSLESQVTGKIPNKLIPQPWNEEPELKQRTPIMKSEPRKSMSQLTVRSRSDAADPVIYPHILQQDSNIILILDFVYQMAEDEENGIIYSAGKYLPLTKWGRSEDDEQTCYKMKETQESSLYLILGFKSVAVLKDITGCLWLHDVVTKQLICFDKDLNQVQAFKGHSIALCIL